MARVPRSSFDTSFFHTIVQGINKEYIFNKEEHIRKYLTLLEKYKEEYNISILAYCIMNNHAHLLLHVQKIEEMSKYMHKVNALYANYYNKATNRVGVLFRNRYQTEPIYNERYLMQCIKYIHMNPVKARMVKRCEEYEFSSAREYTNNYGAAKTAILKEIFGTNFTEWINNIESEKIFYDINENQEETIEAGIKEFETKNGCEYNDIIKSKEKTVELLYYLKNNYKVTYKEISKRLGLTRNEMDNLKRKRK